MSASSQSSDIHACIKNLYEASMYMASELGGLLDELDQRAEMQKPKAPVHRMGGPPRKKTKPTTASVASSAPPPQMSAPPSEGAGAGAGAGAGMYGQPFGAPPSRSEEEYYAEHIRNRSAPGESMAAGPPTPASTQAAPSWGFGAPRGGYTGGQ